MRASGFAGSAPRPPFLCPAPVSPRARKTAAQIGSFVLAGVLLYLALRGIDFGAVSQALRQADYRWLLPFLAAILAAHLLRAWRWQILLDALPGASSEARRVSFRAAFASLMIGYMVNYAAPRLGEVARTANLSARTRRPFGGVFGTVVVERVLDVAVLAVALLSTLALLAERLALLDELFWQPARARLGALPMGLLLLLGLGVALLVVLGGYYAARHERAVALWRARVRPALRSFASGVRTLWRAPRRGALFLSTLAMWACYLLMAYLPFMMLDLAGPHGLSLTDAWCLMALGALGIAVPAPGGVGSYHYIAIQTLVYLYGVPEAPAASYAVLSHGVQLAVHVGLGALALLVQGTGASALVRRAGTTPESTSAPAPGPHSKDGSSGA